MEIKHGSLTGYTGQKCRCTLCKASMAEYNRKRRLILVEHEPKVHGTRSTYLNWACRCDPCTKAEMDYQREYKSRKVNL